MSEPTLFDTVECRSRCTSCAPARGGAPLLSTRSARPPRAGARRRARGRVRSSRSTSPGTADSGRVRGGGYTPELLGGRRRRRARAPRRCRARGRRHRRLRRAAARRRAARARPGRAPPRGRGLAGGGALPDPDRDRGGAFPPPEFRPADADPFVAACGIDLRPIDYARAFAERARRLVLANVGADAPPWWVAAAESAAVERLPERTPAAALAALART